MFGQEKVHPKWAMKHQNDSLTAVTLYMPILSDTSDADCVHILGLVPGEPFHVAPSCSPQYLVEYRRHYCHDSRHLLLQYRVCMLESLLGETGEEWVRGTSSPLEITAVLFRNSQNFWSHNLCSELLSPDET